MQLRLRLVIEIPDEATREPLDRALQRFLVLLAAELLRASARLDRDDVLDDEATSG